MKRTILTVAILGALGGCAMSSGIMHLDGGVRQISASAAPLRGGATGAQKVAYEEAQADCAKEGLNAVMLAPAEREQHYGQMGTAYGTANVNQYGGHASGGASSAPVMGAGSATILYRCAK